MRKRRIKRNRKMRRYQYSIIILFFVIIPLMAVFIGSEITEKIMVPVFYSDTMDEDELRNIINKNIDNDEVDKESGEDEELSYKIELDGKEISENDDMIEEDLNSFSMYLIQVASVSSIENAEDFAKKLSERELSHLISKIDNSYKVYACGSNNRELIESELDNIRDIYPDAYIKEVNVKFKKFKYPKSQEKISGKIIDSINDLLILNKKQSETWYTFVKKEGKMDLYVELLLEEMEIVKKLSNLINENHIAPDFISKKDMQIILDERKENNEIAMELLKEKKDLYKVHNLYLENTFKLIEILK
ncbi:MAG: SPOR domain-containing protein [Clostridiales bacterium]|nr:SPOR domain-containing protein [Clostridiales bacterium]